MRFFLMQRNHPVAVIEIAEKTGDIIDVAEVLFGAEDSPWRKA